MDAIEIDSTELLAMVVRLSAHSGQGTHQLLYDALVGDRPVVSVGTALTTLNTICDEESLRITTALTNLYTLSQQSLQMVHDTFVGTDHDIAAQVAQEGQGV
jgi:hypothetical protein